MKGVHNHVESNEDVEIELYELFQKARNSYLSEVVEKRVRLDYFIDLFLSSHHYIDCDYAKCRNAHRRNLTLIRQLFTDSFYLVEPLLVKSSVSQAELNALVCRHLTSVLYFKKKESYSLGCRFSDRQIEQLACISETYDIFNTMEGGDIRDALRSLFSCQIGFRLQVCHVRRAAVLFDALLDCNMISRNWQNVLHKGHFLVSPQRGQWIKKNSLSSSLNKAKESSAAEFVNIRKAVYEMKKEEQSESW